MKLIKIESLCTLHNSSWSYTDQLLPVGLYKLFFDNGECLEQNYVLTKDVEKVGIKKVLEFSE